MHREHGVWDGWVPVRFYGHPVGVSRGGSFRGIVESKNEYVGMHLDGHVSRFRDAGGACLGGASWCPVSASTTAARSSAVRCSLLGMGIRVERLSTRVFRGCCDLLGPMVVVSPERGRAGAADGEYRPGTSALRQQHLRAEGAGNDLTPSTLPVSGLYIGGDVEELSGRRQRAIE